MVLWSVRERRMAQYRWLQLSRFSVGVTPPLASGEEPALEAQGSFLSGYFPLAFPPTRQWHYLPIAGTVVNKIHSAAITCLYLINGLIGSLFCAILEYYSLLLHIPVTYLISFIYCFIYQFDLIFFRWFSDSAVTKFDLGAVVILCRTSYI